MKSTSEMRRTRFDLLYREYEVKMINFHIFAFGGLQVLKIPLCVSIVDLYRKCELM